MLGGGVLQVMRLVDDQTIGRRKDGGASDHVTKQQGMIDHDHVRVLRAAPGAQEEACAVAHVGAGTAGKAIFSLGAEIGPG